MAKRQHHAEEDDDDNISRASSKRARTDHSDEEEAPQPRRRDGNARDGGRGQRVPDEDSDEEEGLREEDIVAPEFNPDNQMDDEEFDKHYAPILRARMEQKRHNTAGGTVAEHGIIEYIEMHQFMCHKFLKFTFGPQINFIIGHNGSGKSAVLSAITVALGGKAASTGRGNGLKSFIREGQSQSEVSIHIKNQGDEAFKPTEYGKTIVITRRFSRDGASTWKIKSKDGKTISTKKDELAAICDHMNIQVDNPMNVLTQDAARQFLSASAPADKYKFFLRGTQLAQLSEDYETCMQNIRDTTKLLQVKKEAIPDLRAKLDTVTGRYNEAQKARDQKKKLDDLKKELAWAHVATKKAELEEAYAQAASASRRIPKVQAEIEKAEANLAKADEKVIQLEQELSDMPGVAHLDSRQKELAEGIKVNRTNLIQYKEDMRTINESIMQIDTQIRINNDKIAEETRRMAEQSQGKQEKIAAKLAEAKEEAAALDSQLKELIVRRKDYSLDYDNLKQEETTIVQERNRLRDEISNYENDIASARQSENDALVPYGRNMKAVVQRIQSMRWFGERPPVGPLGQYVKARDPKRWGDILRKQLFNALCSFAITDTRDHAALKKILQESGNPGVSIITAEIDLFDYSQGEQPEGVHTVLRELEVSDEYVLRVLINQQSIERIVLAQTREEADNILKKLRHEGHGNNTAWADGFVVKVFKDGGGTSIKTNDRELRGAINLLLTGRDSASEISHLMELKAYKEKEYTQCIQPLSAIQTKLQNLRQEIEQCNRTEARLNKDLRAAKNRVMDLQTEATEDLPVGIQGFEDAKRELESEKENLKIQFKSIAEQKHAADVESTNLLLRLNEVKALIANYGHKREAAVSKVTDAGVSRTEAQSALRHYKAKLAEEEKATAEKDAVAEIVAEELKLWTDKASEYCDEVPNPRKPEDISRLLESVNVALRDRERADGATVEQMTIEVNKAAATLKQAKEEYAGMVRLNKALNASLLARLSRWQEFRRHIALRCKQVFQFHLSQRGYYGKILFDHVQNTLQLKVQTDDQLQTQGDAEKDPRSLSGGEKSFSTICLLLALWDSIGCPLRCLDEFDVFMDAVNRRISMKMMIDTANTSDRKQYVLITPQDMSNVAMGPTVRVHRMIDPERGNGTLAINT